MSNKKVFCPIIKIYIDEYECFETCTVAEGLVKPVIGNKKVLQTPNFREICMNCPNHLD